MCEYNYILQERSIHFVHLTKRQRTQFNSSALSAKLKVRHNENCDVNVTSVLVTLVCNVARQPR